MRACKEGVCRLIAGLGRDGHQRDGDGEGVHAGSGKNERL